MQPDDRESKAHPWPRAEQVRLRCPVLRAVCARALSALRGGAMPALILAMLAATPKHDTRYLIHNFATCQDAASYSAAHPILGRYTYRLRASLADTRITDAGRTNVEGRGRVLIFVSNSQLQLPRWSWRGMSVHQRAAYDAFLAALRQHELGHQTIAQQTIGTRSVDITVLSHSRAGVERALQAAMQTQLQSAASELLRNEQLYDRVTEHGRRQSEAVLYGFPGGPDVEFSCS